MGGLVVVAAGPALDVLLLGQKAFEFGIDLDDGALFFWRFRRRFGGRSHRCRRRGARLAEGRATPAATSGDPPPGPVLTGGLPDRHGGLAADLLLRRRLVREDVAFVD